MRRTRGALIRPDGVATGELDIDVREVKTGGLSDLTGYAHGVEWKWAAALLVGTMECDLVFEGRRVPVRINGRTADEDLTLRFERRGPDKPLRDA